MEDVELVRAFGDELPPARLPLSAEVELLVVALAASGGAEGRRTLQRRPAEAGGVVDQAVDGGLAGKMPAALVERALVLVGAVLHPSGRREDRVVALLGHVARPLVGLVGGRCLVGVGLVGDRLLLGLIHRLVDGRLVARLVVVRRGGIGARPVVVLLLERVRADGQQEGGDDDRRQHARSRTSPSSGAPRRSPRPRRGRPRSCRADRRSSAAQRASRPGPPASRPPAARRRRSRRSSGRGIRGRPSPRWASMRGDGRPP